MAQRLVAEYATTDAFLAAVDLEVANGGLLVRGARPDPEDSSCVVVVRVGGATVGEAQARIDAVARVGVALRFEEPPASLLAAAERLRSQPAVESAAPAPPEHRGTVSERLATLSVAQKIAQAISGDRETRIALLRDTNKTLHAFVLRNPRIQLDEVLFAAKLNTLSPDALKAIFEHAEWGQNLSIRIALVRNPKTPTPIALRLLPQLPQSEVRAIAKGGAKDQLMFAARKLIAG